MKGKLGMISMLAAMAAIGNERPNWAHDDEAIKETDEERKFRMENFRIENNKANGLKEFFYGENSVWAINQKNADRKARNNNWI